MFACINALGTSQSHQSNADITAHQVASQSLNELGLRSSDVISVDLYKVKTDLEFQCWMTVLYWKP